MPAQTHSNPLVLAIDQGTTSTRAILFNSQFQPVATAQQELEQIYPRPGWVEHNPEQIWQHTLNTCRNALKQAAASPQQIAAIGIANQRQTVVVWDRTSGEPLHNAIVWQDRRTAPQCEQLRQQGREDHIRSITGLLCDPYFSATKIAWILNNIPGARQKAQQGQLAAGTIDSFLLWHLTEGRSHATDATNASCTMLYDIHKAQWSPTLLEQFGIPESMLPDVHDCTADFGSTTLLGGSIPIAGIAGDQQAALIGQACFQPGMIKATYGTGCFALINTGSEPVQSRNRLLTTIAYRINGSTTYALEGSIFIAGAAVQWLRDGLGIIKTPEEAEQLALRADPHSSVYLVPAFVGLGAPHWDSECRGTIQGLTRATSAAEIAKAALESAAWQTRDLMEAIRSDWPAAARTILRVDGGMAASEWLLQQLADILQVNVDRPQVLETTALGAAYLAGRQAGLYPPPDQFAAAWRSTKRLNPRQPQEQRYAAWRNAVQRTLTSNQAPGLTP